MPPQNSHHHNPPLTDRHRARVMAALGKFCRRLETLAHLLVFRFRSTEAAETISEYIESINECRTPPDARDRLGEILQSPIGSIKPPQLDQFIRAGLQALFNAMDAADGVAWPRELMIAHDMGERMLDPYACASMDLHELRLSSGARAIYIEIGPDVPIPRVAQSPAASHSNSVGVTPSPAISRRVTASRVGKVPTKIGAAATMACAAT